jgi:hypothetical protein
MAEIGLVKFATIALQTLQPHCVIPAKRGGVSRGWITIGAWWCGTNELWHITKPSV